MSSTDELLTRARFLRNAAPRAFEEFCGAFAAYAEISSEIMLTATHNWQLYQGHAQQCRKLLKVFEEARNG
jgi:hypothetical protein